METVKGFLFGVLVTLFLAVIGLALWIITSGAPTVPTVNSVQPPTIPLVEATATHYVEALPVAPPTIDIWGTSTAFAINQQTAVPPQQPENIIVLGTPEPTREYNITDDQLAACLQAQMEKRRLAPFCPPNPAEYAGPGR